MQTSVVDAARRALGPVGVCLPVSLTSTPHANLQREAVGRLERAGYGAVWANEVIGKDALVQLAMLLAATERTVFGTCIANIWARPAQTMHAAAAQLAQGYPGRFVLGLGVGYPEQAASTGQEFGHPLATMRDYLDRMDSPTWPPAPEAPYPRIIAANGPKMLALAGRDRTWGIPGHAASGVHRTGPAGAGTGQAPGGGADRGSGLRPGSGESDCAGDCFGPTRAAGVRGHHRPPGLLSPRHRRGE